MGDIDESYLWGRVEELEDQVEALKTAAGRVAMAVRGWQRGVFSKLGMRWPDDNPGGVADLEKLIK